jgi:eukaryotic-like serine/threonine-protein kinase
MLGPVAKGTRYRFGPFELNCDDGSLSRNGTRVRVQDLPYRLLLMLVERPGEIITREEVRQRLWPENTFVEFDNSLGVAIRKVRDSLNDDADSPRYVETVPRRGYRFVAPVKVEEPVRSPPLLPTPGLTAPVVATTESPISSSTLSTGAALARDRSRDQGTYWLAAALAVLLVAGTIYVFRARAPRPATSVESTGAETPLRIRRSVAVLGFRNLLGRPEDNWLSPALAEMLNTELAANGALRMVPGEDVARLKRELPLPDEDTLAKATLGRLGTNSGADVVVLGSYTALSGKGDKRIRLDVRVQDTVRGETLSEQSFTGSEANLFELVTQAGQALRQSLGIGSASTEASLEARAALPSNEEAVRFYTEGIQRLWAFDYIQARALLSKAALADPSYPLAHAALADAWNHLGYGARAHAEIARARDLSGHLGPEDRLLIDGQYFSTILDRVRAVDAYRQLFTQFPDNLDFGLRLADELRWLNAADALRVLETLRQLPPPSGGDPRIDYLEARAWVNNDVVKARAASRRAIEEGNAAGLQLLVARAYGVLCQIGDSDSTASDCDEARKRYAAVGDRDNAARTTCDSAILYYEHGDLDRAEGMYWEAIGVFRQIGDLSGVAAASANLGDIALARGHLEKAARILSDAIPGYKEMGDKDGLALTLGDLAQIARLRGNLKAALAGYRQARAIAQEVPDKRAGANALAGAGDVLADQGDLQAARASYQESLALETGDKQNVAETQLALARLSLEEGHAGDAETVIRKCKEQFHQDHQADDEITAATLLAQSLLAENKYADAQKEIDASQDAAGRNQNPLIRVRFDLAAAQTLLASGHAELARAKLQDIQEDARAQGFVGVELEDELTMAHLERKTGKAEAANQQLSFLEKKARSKGFGLVARKAAMGSKRD